MDTATSICAGIIIGFAIIFIIWLIAKYCKWVDKINDKLTDVQCKLDDQAVYICELTKRVKILEYRAINIPYNEEGKGSINPSEADTE